MMLFEHKVVALFFFSILLQGCQNNPTECEGAEGKDMETCKKCVESAQKSSDATAKKEQLKTCAQAVKESKKNQGATTTKGPSTQKKPSFQQVTENIAGNAAQASLAVASSIVQTSAPIELAASSRIIGRSVGSARARQKMTGQVRSGDGESQENHYSGIETQLLANTGQVMRDAVANEDHAFNGIDSLPAAKTAQVTSGASAGQDIPCGVIDSQPVASTAQVRSATSAGQDTSYDVMESPAAAKASQFNDDVTSGPGNLPNSAEPHLQANPAQAVAAAAEIEASAAEAAAEAVEAEAQFTSDAGSDGFHRTAFQPWSNSAHVSVPRTDQDYARHSTESQLEATASQTKVAPARPEAAEAEAAAETSSGGSAAVVQSYRDAMSQPQTNPVQAIDSVSSDVSASIDGLAATQQGALAAMHVSQNDRGNDVSDNSFERKKTTADPKADVLAAAAQATLPVLQQGPANDAPKARVEQQKSADPETLAEISSHPQSASDANYNQGKQGQQQPKGLNQVRSENAYLQKHAAVEREKQERVVNSHNSNVQRQSTMDAQKQERVNSDNSDMQKQPTMDVRTQMPVNSDNSDVQKQATVETHKQEHVVNSDNSYDSVQEQGSFQAVIGTSGKVARIGKPRYGAQGARIR